MTSDDWDNSGRSCGEVRLLTSAATPARQRWRNPHKPVLAVSSARFTLDGSEELERRLAGTCDTVLAEVLALVSPERLEGLVLGGGYGRGEGGVLETEKGDEPYNDLEFYVFLRGPNWWNERQFGPALNSLAHSLSSAAGVDV